MKAAGIILAWAVILFTVAAAVCGIAGNGGLLASEMLRNAPPEVTGLPEKEYEAVGRMTADYLSVRTDVFQHTFSDENGTIYQCFQPHEAEHMADCRELIRRTGILRWIAAGAARPRNDRRRGERSSPLRLLKTKNQKLKTFLPPLYASCRV